ncbi:MAG: hypothetical protein IJ408_02850 [Clostridia bacterium]|nr:hypothetical protein [Clostridia bacterium]
MSLKLELVNLKEPNSMLRKVYIARLIARCIAFVLVLLLLIFKPAEFEVLNGFNFFKRFSLLHLLWGVWVIDMLFQLIPAKSFISIGSQKHFKQFFRPLKEKINKKALKEYIVTTTKSAYLVFILWVVLVGGIGILTHLGILNNNISFMISTAFYVFDLICVVIWCPFRIMINTRCCTTCRIFNWDHMMMFTPMSFIPGFFSASLIGIAAVVFIVWELCVLLYPERFWENTNESLRCINCTDKLCNHTVRIKRYK